MTQFQTITFRPTMEDLSSFEEYISYMESREAHKAGIAKIIPPKAWVARKDGYDDPTKMALKMGTLVNQHISLKSKVGGCFLTKTDNSGPSVTLSVYQQLANSAKHLPPSHTYYNELEQFYWQGVLSNTHPTTFTAEVQASLTDQDQHLLNMARLPNILTGFDDEIPEICLPRISVGMWRSTSCWQVEDMDTYALRYVHSGKPITHYCVPPEFGYQFEQVAQKVFPGVSKECFNLFRHKNIIISPKLLSDNNIPVIKVVLDKGSFLVLFPHAYHFSFSHGFNIVESVNFGTQRWVEYGKRCRECVCSKQTFNRKIDMRKFVQTFQPRRYPFWQEDKDFQLHPEDPEYLRRFWEDVNRRLEHGFITKEQFNDLREGLKRKREVVEWFRHKFPNLDYDGQYELVDNSNLKAELDKKYPSEEAGRRGIIKDERLGNKTETRKRSAIVKDDNNNKSKRSVFKCPSNKIHKKTGCKKCPGCKAPECNVCIYCLDKPKNGGRLVLKQKCKERVCENPVMGTCAQCK